MHSYISSSNKPYNAGSWLVIWLVSFVLAGGVLIAAEFFFRVRGHLPSVIDDELLWACHRHRIYDAGKKKPVVILGASRVLLGFVPGVFEQHFPEYRIVQLAVGGAHPFAALRDLANDERFNGIVIVSITLASLSRSNREDQQPYVDFYHDTFLSGCYRDDEFNRSVSTFFQKNTVVTNHELRWDNIAMNLIRNRSFPARNYYVTHSDRSRSADYEKIDVAAHRRERIQKLQEGYERQNRIAPEVWLNQAMEVEPFVRAIQRRGGKVVFVRYITTGEHYELDEKYYPKSKYWDQFAKKTEAVTIHFKDVPELSNFECPDTSHLDFRDAPRFTVSLGHELRRLGVIR